MAKTFLNYIRRFFYPESTEINAWIFKVKYGEGLRKDALKVVNELKSKRVLFASMDHELWEHVFKSLKNISSLIINLNVEIGYKGPNDLIQNMDYVLKSITFYLSEYEYSYMRFMQTPSLQSLAPAHKERNWPELGDAAKDLILLRKVIHMSIKNLNEFAYNGKVVDWEEPNFHMAEHWIRYADGRKLCPSCGLNLYYSATGYCPKCFEGVTFKLEGLYGKSNVFITGNFNDWKTNDWEMKQSEYGTFIYQIKLNPGKYLYKYIVDGVWVLDCTNALQEVDENQNINSVLMVR